MADGIDAVIPAADTEYSLLEEVPVLGRFYHSFTIPPSTSWDIYINGKSTGGGGTGEGEVTAGNISFVLSPYAIVGPNTWSVVFLSMEKNSGEFGFSVDCSATAYDPVPSDESTGVNTRLSRLEWSGGQETAVFKVYINDVYQGQTSNRYWSLSKVYTSPPTPWGAGYYLPLRYFTEFTWRVDAVTE